MVLESSLFSFFIIYHDSKQQEEMLNREEECFRDLILLPLVLAILNVNDLLFCRERRVAREGKTIIVHQGKIKTKRYQR